MENIADELKNLYNSLSEDAISSISTELVEEALNVAQNYHVHSTKELFYYLSAINYLNAAIKRKEFSKELKYGLIKGKAAAIAEYVIDKQKKIKADYYYNSEERCLYIRVYGVVFSFHSVSETDFILEKAAKKDPIIWEGIRLQRIAEPLFLLSKEIANVSTFSLNTFQKSN